MMRRFAWIVALAAAWSGSAQADTDPAHGYWLTENGKAIIQFAPCGAKVCGRMVWVANPTDASGQPKLDVKNDAPEMRDRPLCGLQLLGDLSPDKTGSWDDGWIYSPKDGSTYSAKIETLSETELEVRGYLGISLLGGSQVWTRVDGDRGGCPG